MARSEPSTNVFTFLEVFEENLVQIRNEGSLIRGFNNENKIEVTYSYDEREEVVKEGENFLSKFEAYLRRGEYTKSSSDLQLVESKLAGLKNEDIEAQLDIKASTLRMRYARLTKKVYKSAFNKEFVPDDLVWLANARVVKKATECLHEATLRYSLSEVFSVEALNAIKKATSGVDRKSKASDREYCEVLRFISIYSWKTFKTVLDSLSPTTLAYVLNEMTSKKINSTCSLYNKFMEKPEDTFKMTTDDFNYLVNQLDFNYRNRGDLGRLDDTLIDTKALQNKLKERERELDTREQELRTREIDLDMKLKELPYKLGITEEMYKVLADYIKSYDRYASSVPSMNENIYMTHKGENLPKNAKDTMETIERFFKVLTPEGFKRYLYKLNPYQLKLELDLRYKNDKVAD